MKVATFYVDYGKAWYREAGALMIESAHKIGLEAIHLTDSETEPLEGADGVARLDRRVPFEEIGVANGMFRAQFVQDCDDDLIFCDQDVIFNRVPEFGDWDLGLLFREDPRAHIRFNGGFVYSRKGGGAFWQHYSRFLSNLPPILHGWYGQQIVFAMMLGADRKTGDRIEAFGASVECLDYYRHAPAPKVPPVRKAPTVALHFKGEKKKSWMFPYATLVGCPYRESPQVPEFTTDRAA